jgi:hypothetical protein
MYNTEQVPKREIDYDLMSHRIVENPMEASFLCFSKIIENIEGRQKLDVL